MDQLSSSLSSPTLSSVLEKTEVLILNAELGAWNGCCASQYGDTLQKYEENCKQDRSNFPCHIAEGLSDMLEVTYDTCKKFSKVTIDSPTIGEHYLVGDPLDKFYGGCGARGGIYFLSGESNASHSAPIYADHYYFRGFQYDLRLFAQSVFTPLIIGFACIAFILFLCTLASCSLLCYKKTKVGPMVSPVPDGNRGHRPSKEWEMWFDEKTGAYTYVQRNSRVEYFG